MHILYGNDEHRGYLTILILTHASHWFLQILRIIIIDS